MATEVCGGAKPAAPGRFNGQATPVTQRDSRRYRIPRRMFHVPERADVANRFINTRDIFGQLPLPIWFRPL